MGIKQLYNDNLRKLPNEYGDVSVMNIVDWAVKSQSRYWYFSNLSPINMHKTYYINQSSFILHVKIK